MIKFIKDIFKDTCTGLYSVIRIVFSVCLITGIFYCSYNFLSEKFVNHDVYDGSDFHNLPEDSMDIIVLGSSHAQYSYVPAYMYQDTGLYSYVLGSACQPYEVSYEMLKEALKTQNPELVVMEAFTATPLSSTCAGDGCYVMAAYQMRDEEKLNVINMLPKEKAKTYYNEFINCHNDWKTAENLKELFIKEKNTYYENNFGYLENPFHGTENYWYPYMYENSTLEVELDETDLNAINNIKKLCDSKGIKLMLYMVPMDSITEEDQAYRYKIWEWAKENSVLYQDYVDQAEEIGFKMCIYSDGFHSYSNGASLITHKLSKFISENYTFNSHVVNSDIENKHIQYMKDYAYSLYSTEANPNVYLDSLQNYKGLYLFRYYPGIKMTAEIVEKIQNLGMIDFDSKSPYYAIFNDGNIIASGVDYAYANINGIDYLVRDDQIVQGSTQIPYEGNINIVIFNQTGELYITKNIEKVKPDWWNYGNDYWEHGYDMFYSKIN